MLQVIKPFLIRSTENTALVGVVRKEINCLPIENEEYARIMTQRAKEAQAPKRETELITGVGPNAGNLLAPGHLGAGGNFGNFIVRPCILGDVPCH